MTETGQAPGPMAMSHHRKPAPEITPEQRRIINDNRRAARDRRSSKPTSTSQVQNPFDLLPAPEPDPFA